MTTPTSGAYPRTLPRFPTDSPDRLVLTLWTADATLARYADAAGVDRIGVDLERLGKADRQQGLGTWISPHTERDLAALRPAIVGARLFARLNPLHPGTARELEAVLRHGADVLMLPMVARREDAERFVELVAGRAAIVLLLERREALERIDELTAVTGIEEVHLGLNDLALSLGLPNRWLLLAEGVVDEAARAIRAAGLRFGFGGIGRARDRSLPIPADLVYAEYARTGATAALLARSFVRPDGNEALADDVAEARAELAAWRAQDQSVLDEAHAELSRRARSLSSW
jgi:2-keto-3-deoxy-L-rhamnonate aldolase RhmA